MNLLKFVFLLINLRYLLIFTRFRNALRHGSNRLGPIVPQKLVSHGDSLCHRLRRLRVRRRILPHLLQVHRFMGVFCRHVRFLEVLWKVIVVQGAAGGRHHSGNETGGSAWFHLVCFGRALLDAFFSEWGLFVGFWGVNLRCNQGWWQSILRNSTNLLRV
jgi:hypothetical protein